MAVTYAHKDWKRTGRLASHVVVGGVMAGTLAAGPAWAGPQGQQVVAGNATFARQGDVTQITAANNTIIRYDSFNIAGHEAVRFIQPSASARVLNRIDGVAPTHLDGRLSANGIVYFANPAGVFIGSRAVIDVGGIVAAAGHIADADFLNHIDRFTGLRGPVENHGAIHGQVVSLIGQYVANHGSIVAEGGLVTLVAGDEVLIGQRDGHVMVKLDASRTASGTDAAGAAQATPAAAEGGQASLAAGDLYSLAIHNRGAIKGREVTLAAGPGAKVQVDGTIDASAPAGGGSVRIEAGQVALAPTAAVRADATDKGDGGNIRLVAGDLQVAGVLSAAGRDGAPGYILLDPLTFTIDAGNVAALVAALDGANLDIEAQNTITVSVTFDSSAQANAHTLSLLDENNPNDGLTINLDAPILLGANQTLFGEGTVVNLTTAGAGMLQTAVNAATHNAVITVSDGLSFSENLLVRNRTGLTLQSDTAGVDPVVTFGAGVGVDIDGTAGGFTLGGAAADTGFALNSGAGTTFLVQLANAPANVTVQRSALDLTSGGGSASQGISAGAAGADGLSLLNNQITAGDGDGAVWGPNVSNVTISGNTFIGPGTASGYAIQFSGITGTSSIDHNTISDFNRGVFLYSSATAAVDGVSITDNTISGSAKQAVYLSNLAGSQAIGNVTITGNTLTGNDVGVQVDADSGGVVFSMATIVVNDNDLSGNTTAGVRNLNSGLLDATGNWWGSVNGPTHAANLFNVGAQGVAASGALSFAPWRTGGGDQDAGVAGYQQPVPNDLFAPVTNLDTGEGFASIQAAHDDADTLATHTLRIAEGAFAEAVTLTKNVELSAPGGTATATNWTAAAATIGGDFAGAFFTFNGATALGADTSLTTSADGAVAFNSTLAGGGFSLEIAAGAGTVTFGGAASNLVDLDVTSGAFHLNGKLTASGAVDVDASGDISITAAIDPTTVTLDSDGDIAISALISADDLITLLAGTDGTGGVAFTGPGGLSATAAGSDVSITTGATSGGVALGGTGGISAVDAITINAPAGAITRTAGTLTGASATLLAGTGVGAGGAPIVTAVANLEGASGTGGVFVSNTGSLTIGGIGATAGLAATTSGNLELTNVGDLALAENLTAGSGRITLNVTGNTTQTTGVISAASLELLGAGNYLLGGANAVGTLAANVTGGVTFNDGDALGIGIVGGTTGITTSGATVVQALGLSVGSAVSGAGVTLSGGSGALATTATVTSTGGNDLNLAAQTISLGANVSGTGQLNLVPAAVDTGIGIGDGAAGAFNLSAAEIAFLVDGFAGVNIGTAVTGAHDIEVTDAIFTDPLALLSPAGGTITLQGTLTGTGNASILIDGAGATTVFGTDGASIVTSGLTVTISDSVVVGDGVNAVIDSTNGGGTPAGADITITGTVNGTAGDPPEEQLVMNAGTVGSPAILGLVGGVDDVELIMTGATVTIPAGNYGDTNPIFTSNNIIFAAGVADSIQGTGNITIQPLDKTLDIGIGFTTGAWDITQAELGTLADGFASITFGRTDGEGTMTLNTGASGVAVAFRDAMFLRMPAGDIVINDAGGGVESITQAESAIAANIRTKDPFNSGTPLSAGLTFLAANATTFLEGLIVTNGTAVEFPLAVELTNPADIRTTGGGATGGDIIFGSTLVSEAGFQHRLDLDAGTTGNVHFAGLVGGGGQRLGAVTIDSALTVNADAAFTANSVTQTAGVGDTSFFGVVTTSGLPGQAGGVVDITTAGNVLFDASILALGGGNVGGNGLAGGAVTLTGLTVSVRDITTDGSTAASGFTGGAAGAITLDAEPDGGSVALGGSLLARGGAGPGGGTQGAGADINVGGSGDTTDAIGIGVGTITVSTGTTAGDIFFNGPVNGSGHLTVEAGAGDILFRIDAGGTTRLGNLVIESARDVTFREVFVTAATNAVRAASITQNSGTGTTTFNGAVDTNTLPGISLSGAAFTFNGTVATTSGGPVTVVNTGLVDINSGATFSLDGAFTQNGAGAVQIAADITTTGDDIDFAGPLTITDSFDLTLSTGAGSVGSTTFGGTVDAETAGDETLTLINGLGSITFGDDVGGAARLGGVTVNNAVNVGVLGSLTSVFFLQSAGTGTTTFAGAVDVDSAGAAFDVTTAGLTIGGGGSLAASGGGTILMTVNAADLGGGPGSIAGTSTLTIQPRTAGLTINLGSGSGGLDLSATEVASFAEGFTLITLGRANGTGQTNIDGVAFTDPTLFLQPLAGGRIDVNGPLTGTDDATFTFDTRSTFLGGTITTAGRNVLFQNGAVLGVGGGDDQVNNVTVDGFGAAVITTGSGMAAGADVTFENTIDAFTVPPAFPGAEDLTLDAGTGGTIEFTGAVGATRRMGPITIANALDVNWRSTVAAESLAQIAGQGTTRFFGSINTNVVTGIDLNGVNFVFGDGLGTDTVTTTSGGPVTITHTGLLTILGNANFVLDGPFHQDDATTGTVSLAADISTTADAIRFDGPVTLADAVALSGSTTTFTSTVDGAFTLAVTGNAVFGDAAADRVGGGVALAGLSVSGVTTLVTDAVTTTGDQTYTGAVLLAQPAPSPATTTLVGHDITFGSTLDESTAGGVAAVQNLVINTTGGGVTTFAGTVGGVTPLGSITTDSGVVDGTTRALANMTTDGGTMTFNDPFLVGADIVLTDLGGTGLFFNNRVDSTVGGHFALTVTTSGLAKTRFGDNLPAAGADAVGGADALSALTAHGLVELNAGAVTTTGNQTYHGAVELGEGFSGLTTLTGVNVSFNGTLNETAAAAFPQNLVVNAGGITLFAGVAGGTVGRELRSITTDAPGSTRLGADMTTDGGGITLNDPAVLVAGVTLTETAGGDIHFLSTLDGDGNGPWNLTLNTAGAGIFDAAVGAGSPLGNLVTDAAGLTRINGGCVATVGDQTYNDPVHLGQDTTLTGNDITFNNTIDALAEGEQGLTVNSTGSGITSFLGTVGGSERLAFVETNADGVTIIGADIHTGGTDPATQTYNDPVILVADVLLSDTGSTGIRFFNTLDSDDSVGDGSGVSLDRDLTLAISGGGSLLFDREVGSQFRLGDLTILATVANVTGNADVRARSVTQVGGTGDTAFAGILGTYGDPANDGEAGGAINLTTAGNIDIAEIDTRGSAGTAAGGAGGAVALASTSGNITVSAATTDGGSSAGASAGAAGGALVATAAAGDVDLGNVSTRGGTGTGSGAGGAGGAIILTATGGDATLDTADTRGGEASGAGTGGAGGLVLLTALRSGAGGDVYAGGINTSGGGSGAGTGGAAGHISLAPDAGLTDGGAPVADPLGPALTDWRPDGRLILTGDLTALGGLGGAGDGAGGNVNLAPAGRADIPSVATVYSTPLAGSDVTIAADTIAFGQNEKATFFGDATLIASTEARIGDTSVLGTFTVTAPLITMLNRPVGPVLNLAGMLDVDLGMDIVVGVATAFSTVPVVADAGSPDPIFASADGNGDVLSTIAANLLPDPSYIYRSYGAVLAATFTAPLDTPPPAGVVLDLNSAGPSITNVADALAGAIPRVQPILIKEPFRPLPQEFGLAMKSLEADQLLEFLLGRALYTDLPSNLFAKVSDRAVTVDRLTWEPVTAAINAYRVLFLEESTDAQTGVVTYKSRHVEMRNTLKAALEAFQARAAGKPFDAEAFRAFLESAEGGQAQAAAIVRGLGDLYTRLAIAGLTRAELDQARAKLAEPLAPPGMTAAQLNATVSAKGQAPVQP